METSYTCDFNFAVLDSQNLFFVNKVTVKYWDLRKGGRVRLIEVTI